MVWTWFYPFPQSAMRWLLHRYFRKTLFPWWFSEHIEGNLRAVVGQTLTASGDIEVIVKIQHREKLGNWKDVGIVRYLDVPCLKRLLHDVDSYVNSLLTQG